MGEIRLCIFRSLRPEPFLMSLGSSETRASSAASSVQRDAAAGWVARGSVVSLRLRDRGGRERASTSRDRARPRSLALHRAPVLRAGGHSRESSDPFPPPAASILLLRPRSRHGRERVVARERLARVLLGRLENLLLRDVEVDPRTARLQEGARARERDALLRGGRANADALAPERGGASRRRVVLALDRVRGRDARARGRRRPVGEDARPRRQGAVARGRGRAARGGPRPAANGGRDSRRAEPGRRVPSDIQYRPLIMCHVYAQVIKSTPC